VESIDWGRIGHSGRLNHFIQVIIYVVWILSTVFRHSFALSGSVCLLFAWHSCCLLVMEGNRDNRFSCLFGCFVSFAKERMRLSPAQNLTKCHLVAQGMWERVCAS
jgi:hypothetical protein